MSLGFALAESAISGAFKSISPFSKERKTGNINWGDYNYPPCFSVIHYDSDDIEHPKLKSVVVMMHRIFLITVFTCCLNLFDNIVDSAFYPEARFEWVVYSALNIAVLCPIALYIFFTGFKGMALTDPGMLQKYAMMGAIQAIFYFLFAIMPFGATNGLLSISMFHVGVYWMIAIIVESALWATAFGMLVYTILFIFRGDYLMLPVTTTTTRVK